MGFAFQEMAKRTIVFLFLSPILALSMDDYDYTRLYHPGKYNPEAAQNLIEKNRVLENALARGMSLAELQEQGFIKLGQGNVTMGNTPLPVIEVRFPFAHTGIYVYYEPPKGNTTAPNLASILTNAFDPQRHKGIIVFLPGAGSTYSNAKSVWKVASYFQKKPSNRGEGPGFDLGYRMAAFAMDLPGNGMGTDSPLEFSTFHGLTSVLHHVRLVLHFIYGNKPFYFAGRSQGGLAALSYSKMYKDVSGVIAVNPTHPFWPVMRNMARIVETPELVEKVFGKPVDIHLPSWSRVKFEGSEFPTFLMPTKTPELILLGQKDPSYGALKRGKIDAGHYFKLIQLYRSHTRGVAIQIFDNGGHDLWNRDRENIPTFIEVVRRMLDFFEIQSPKTLDLSALPYSITCR